MTLVSTLENMATLDRIEICWQPKFGGHMSNGVRLLTKKNIWFRKTSLKLLKKNLVDHFSMSVDPLSIDNFTIQSEICEENEFLANIGLLSTTT